jgi:hypothetical protein
MNFTERLQRTQTSSKKITGDSIEYKQYFEALVCKDTSYPLTEISPFPAVKSAFREKSLLFLKK